MGLRVWDQLNDPYDHTQQANNWARVDYHDHTPGRGVQIPSGGIEAGAITPSHLSEEITTSGLLPAGIVLAYAGLSPLQDPTAIPPAGYLFADGVLYDGTLAPYTNLWNAIGTYFGGTGIGSFAVPNLCKTTASSSQGRFPVGVRTTAALGVTGGEERHTLSVAEMPSHSHGVSDPGHTHGLRLNSSASAIRGVNFTEATGNYVSNGESILEAAGTGVTVNAAGSGGDHNNMPPFQAMNYIIKL